MVLKGTASEILGGTKKTPKENGRLHLNRNKFKLALITEHATT